MATKTLLTVSYAQGKLDPRVYTSEAGDRFEEPELLPGFSLLLHEIFS